MNRKGYSFAISVGVALYLFSGTVVANTVETWTCKDILGTGPVLVTAKVNKGRTTGEIDVAGVTHKTHFVIEGFNRRWDFGRVTTGKRKGDYKYSFIIEPDGRGNYIDFSYLKSTGLAPASQVMKCQQQ